MSGSNRWLVTNLPSVAICKKMVKKCVRCKRKNLGSNNASGYCIKCYRHSPKYLEYQRIKQREFYHQHPEKQRAYNRRPDIRIKRRKYMKKYVQEHIERVRELKNNWARKQNEQNIKKKKRNNKKI
jgi:hypothetical protein